MKFLTFTICLTLAVCATAFAGGNYAVLMQESPAGAGEIQPGIGVHKFGVNEKVTLNTVPKKGYKFVYWLGDVSDPTANRTTMSVDGPKIVIAVFERDAYELPSASAAVCQGPAGLTPRYDVLSSGSPDPYTPPDDPDDPDDPDNPVPEPGTMILLTSGVFILRKRLFEKH
jgi:hypothetical protein